MKRQVKIKRLFILMSTIGTIGIANTSFAAAYQLWEQDGASEGNYHAGRAAIAEDASTAYYNPAGLIRIQNQQLVMGAAPIVTDFLFRGNVQVNTFGPSPRTVTTQGGAFGFVPSAHYAAPIAKNLVFGLSVVSPFGLKTDYEEDTFVRYVATKTSLRVVDFSPSIGFAFNDYLSVGMGFDSEYARGEFDLVGGAITTRFDSKATNIGSGNAFGYHLGALYQLSQATRVGLAFHSQVRHHLAGDSKFEGHLANDFADGRQKSDNLKVSTTLPPTTSLSAFHSFNPVWDLMGTVSYTKWDVVRNLVIENVAGVDAEDNSSNDIIVIIPENYRNTWNYSVGANYHVNPQWFIRTGLGFDETPSNDIDRNMQLPDSNRFVLACGWHYQPTKTLGLDMGWSHFFAKDTTINNNVEIVGGQRTVTDGDVSANADVYSFQMKWDIV